MQDVTIAMLGFGNVGRALAKLFLEKRAELQEHHQIAIQVVGISTLRHGTALDPKGIDLKRALSLAESGEDLSSLSKGPSPKNSVNFIHHVGADVLFENTPVNYETGQPAVSHIRTALERGMHAVTANKGPIVHAHRVLADLAQGSGLCFHFESTVMGGAPIFSLWREALPAARLHAFRGILNSTTNLILTLMDAGKTFDQAVTHAQEIGIAESDPSGDTEGWDAAIKVAALVTVLMGIPLTPNRVKREGIENLSSEDVVSARADGRRWKLVCEAEREGNEVKATVHPEMIESSDPLYHVMGTSSAVTFKSDVLGDLTVMEADPGPQSTAYGLFADFINALRSSS